MSAADVCPLCGKPLPSDGPKGQCPACLLGAALAGQSSVHSAAAALPNALATSATAPEAGTLLKYFGDYELLEKLARGGMGVVWKARQTSLKRDVAIKMIRAGALAGPDEVERFLREAEAAANLQHPNIVAIHEVGEHDGQHYFSMDYVAGRDLGAIVKDGPLPPRIAARYVKIIAEAVHFAHQRGTLHRDLKPQNVLIDAGDQPRITDFGLAKFMNDDSRMTQTGVVMGSPSYMPPEQAGGRQSDIGPASDVYSLGAMLYELLTGQPPFRGSTPMATLLEVLEAEPAAPRRLKADIPPDLETICLKCLEKSPSARYPTAQALAEELDRFLDGEPIKAEPASAVRKVVSWTRRNPGAMAALAALLMITLAFGVFYLFEENAFLRAQQADPTLARIPGRLHDSLQNGIWGSLTSIWIVAATLSFLSTVQGPAEGLARRQVGYLQNPFSLAVNNKPILPLDERTRICALFGGLILVGYSVVFAATAIQALVWEGESPRGHFVVIYWPISAGLMALALVIRDYRLVHYGISSTSSSQLTAEQIAPIRRALEDHNLLAAVQCYREAVPGARQAEAKQYVVRLFHTLRAQQPDKFAPSSSSLDRLNWRPMLTITLIEVPLFGALWLLVAPSYQATATLHFACSFMLVLGTMISQIMKRVWTLLLMVPSLAVTILIETAIPRPPEASSDSGNFYIAGLIFGGLAAFAALIPRRSLEKLRALSRPTIDLRGTIAKLRASFVEMNREAKKDTEALEARRRKRRLAEMAANPGRTIDRTERLAVRRSASAYRDIARLLSDLREALAGTDQHGMAERQALKLTSGNPTPHQLTSELQSQGFLKK